MLKNCKTCIDQVCMIWTTVHYGGVKLGASLQLAFGPQGLRPGGNDGIME